MPTSAVPGTLPTTSTIWYASLCSVKESGPNSLMARLALHAGDGFIHVVFDVLAELGV